MFQHWIYFTDTNPFECLSARVTIETETKTYTHTHHSLHRVQQCEIFVEYDGKKCAHKANVFRFSVHWLLLELGRTRQNTHTLPRSCSAHRLLLAPLFLYSVRVIKLFARFSSQISIAFFSLSLGHLTIFAWTRRNEFTFYKLIFRTFRVKHYGFYILISVRTTQTLLIKISRFENIYY